MAHLAPGLVLALHAAVIAFNVFGLVAVPIGAWRRLAFVHAPVWRLAHIASLAVTAAQALAGQSCFLTILEDRLTGARGGEPLIMRLVNAAIFWPLPFWVFEALYVAVFGYALALLWLVPIRWRAGSAGRPQSS